MGKFVSGLTDELLRSERDAGLNPSQIARKYHLARQTVRKRLLRMEGTTVALTTVATLEARRYVNAQIDILEEMARSLQRVKQLSDACDDWLTDAADPTRYDIGPRSDEIMVTYWDNSGDGDKPVQAKATLRELLARVEKGGILTVSAESKHADPRELILKTAKEVRQTVQSAVELAQLLADARAMERFREALIEALRTASPEIAEKCARAVRSVVLLHRDGTPDAAG